LKTEDDDRRLATASCASVHVLDLLKTTKLDGVFAIHQGESTAIQSFSRSAEATA